MAAESGELNESESDCGSQIEDPIPYLVWKKILENCWSWEYPEMLNFLLAGKLPDDLALDAVRTNLFFQALLPTLTSNYVGSNYTELKHHASLLDFKDIYNCRLVCRAWNSVIRKNVVSHVSRLHPNCCLQEWESNFLWPRESRNHYANHCNDAYSRFFLTSQIAKFLSSFKQNHRGDVNPFHCHHVSFWLYSDNTSQSMNRAAEVFAQFGTHLRLLNFLLNTGKANPVDGLYPGVLELLRGTPNLEALRISWLSVHPLEELWKSNVNANTGNCPELKLLTHLEVDGVPHSLFNDIIRSNGGHIEKLKISGLEVSRYALFRKYALHRVPLTNLRELRIIFECATTNDIVRLAKSAPHWTQLKKVHLDFEGNGQRPKSISWHLILQCLNKFSSTVTHLWLRFPTLDWILNVGLHDYCSTREEQLKLPNLEQIVLKFPIGSCFCLDFLFGLDNLKTLYIYGLGDCVLLTDDPLCIQKCQLLREYLKKLGPQKIQLSRDMQHSNIWEQFPKLFKLYWHQIGQKCAWKKMKGKSRADPTAWTLRDTVEEIPEYWAHYRAHLPLRFRVALNTNVDL